MVDLEINNTKVLTSEVDIFVSNWSIVNMKGLISISNVGSFKSLRINA